VASEEEGLGNKRKIRKKFQKMRLFFVDTPIREVVKSGGKWIGMGQHPLTHGLGRSTSKILRR
jgi:hypothetical protein